MGCAAIAVGAASAAAMFSVSRVFCVENENVRTALAAGTPTAPAICRCAPVSRQMPFMEPVSVAQVGSADLIVA
jgi:hypothetical protein